jgi:hypothetical protein
MVLFSKRMNLEGFFAPKLFDTELILNNQLKYLEVTLDSKLNWKFHIDNRIKKASIAYWQCRAVLLNIQILPEFENSYKNCIGIILCFLH